jgi:hypothetical protein
MLISLSNPIRNQCFVLDTSDRRNFLQLWTLPSDFLQHLTPFSSFAIQFVANERWPAGDDAPEEENEEDDAEEEEDYPVGGGDVVSEEPRLV